MGTINVDVDIDEVLYELDDDDLVEELEHRGWFVSKEKPDFTKFDKEDWLFILSMFDKIEETWETTHIRDKVLKACYE